MQRALSTRLFVNHRLTTAWLDKLSRAGIPHVEIFCARQHLDYHNKAQIAELGHWFQDGDLKLLSLHSPIFSDEVWGRSGPDAAINIGETVKRRRIAMVDEIKRALEIAETIPFRYLVQHLDGNDDEYDEHRMDAAFTSLEEISVFAKQRGVAVLLENTAGAMTSAEQLRIFLGQTHLDLNYCFDVANAHMGEGIESAYAVMKDRIRSVHIHDTDGAGVSHLFPLMDASAEPSGTIDWKATMKLLAARAGQYPFVLELHEVPDLANPFEAAIAVFEKLENLSKPDEQR